MRLSRALVASLLAGSLAWAGSLAMTGSAAVAGDAGSARAGAANPSAATAACPGNPNALGTSRTLVIDPSEHVRLGMMQYRETLPLGPKEVVITFDDGPLPPYTNRALDILASECVKVTYFLVGRMARAYPEVVRKIQDAGHTIGTHSFSHPLSFHKMPMTQAEQEIEGGIAAVGAALGDRAAVAPFFRIPGLLRRDEVERLLASRGLMTWSADFPADDWKHIPASEVMARALQRIEARGRGMLLLHDIQPATVLALPGLLHELKARGYKIVHVVPASATLAKTATLPEEWLVRRGSGAGGGAGWPTPRVTIETLLADPILPTYDPKNLGIIDALGPAPVVARSRLRSYRSPANAVPLPPESPWPRHQAEETAGRAADMPVVLPTPAMGSFGRDNDFAPASPVLGTAGRVTELPPLPIFGPPERSAGPRVAALKHAAPTASRPVTGSATTGAAPAGAPVALTPPAPPPPVTAPSGIDHTGAITRPGLLGRWPFSTSSLPRLGTP
ncbi:polysaccharide deacetylase family protein [Rhodoplanes serenus]|uniref:polysaccharide deacetylase family protein n=1 Tax=Rhodoplanes serenus TaxID=200615 RepID=UPI002545CDE8|nr:polysaccharide deacetylase family protein [Rhodoplanes serenus]